MEAIKYKLEKEEGSSNPHLKTFLEINSKLLVRRDPLYLAECLDGTVENIREMPSFLSQSPLSIPPELLNIRSSRDDLLKTRDDIVTLDCPPGTVPSVWSGRRSALTIDPRTKNLYKLKGVAIAELSQDEKYYENGALYLEGGQFLWNAHNERIYSDRFNKILADNGVEPVMEYVGFYKSPFKVRGHKIAASIIRVKGDTRLDELMYALEAEAYFQTTYTEGQKAELTTQLGYFYKEVGYIVGQLKRLMDRGNQTWSDNPKRTNAHIGNIVVYPTDEKNLMIGLVDFDASCDGRDMSKKQLREQQIEEYRNIPKSTLEEVASARAIGLYYYPELKFSVSRFNFGLGFMAGYESKKIIKPTLEMSRLTELKELINAGKIPRPRLIHKKPVEAGIRYEHLGAEF
ncbi:MAG: hypothetical protein AABX31_00580 [Nanoarchaeota archaeon]